MGPSQSTGNEEEWPKWKEEIEDYIEAVHPGLKHAIILTSKAKEEVTEKTLRDEEYVWEEWKLREAIFTLLKKPRPCRNPGTYLCVFRGPAAMMRGGP